MDDVKVYSKSKEVLKSALQVGERTSVAVGKEFWYEKCATAVLNGDGGAMIQRIPDLTEGQSHKYLGWAQRFGVSREVLRTRLEGELLKRVQLVWASAMPLWAKVKAYNTCCVALLQYYVPAAVWYPGDLDQLEVRVKAVLRRNFSWAYGQAKERLTLPKSLGGLGLLSLRLLRVDVARAVLAYLRHCANDNV